MTDRPDVPILVTGATGNVGRSVVQELQRLDVPFFAGGSDPLRTRQALGDDIETRTLDFLRPETYADAVRGIGGLDLLDEVAQVVAGDGGIAADHGRPGFLCERPGLKAIDSE